MIGRIFMTKYKTISLLGEGGMGKVYLAHPLEDPNRRVVVKVLHKEHMANPLFRDAFRKEIDFMARFRHPYAVRLYEGSINEPQGPCIIMEYVDGLPLDELLQRHGRLRVDRVGRFLVQLCSALQAAHVLGIIHRDLKPANIMVVGPDTPDEYIKVLDFGLAKLATGLSGVPYIALEKLNATEPNLAVGTPEYMSPEQIRGDEMDHRGDLYSVGIILFELLTGRRPFDRPTLNEILQAQVYDPPPPFIALGVPSWMPPGIEPVVHTCLAKEPASGRKTPTLAKRFEAALGEKLIGDEDALFPPQAVKPVTAGGSRSVSAKMRADKNTSVYELDAWMPESIAVMKLRGFMTDVGGVVIESVPGLIRMRLARQASAPKAASPGMFSWLGLGKKGAMTEWIDMELYMEKKDASQQNQLHITLLLKPVSKVKPDDGWDDWCEHINGDVRAYLMAKK